MNESNLIYKYLEAYIQRGFVTNFSNKLSNLANKLTKVSYPKM